MYLDRFATKQGLCKALCSGNPAYKALPEYFNKRLRPALTTLLDAAAEIGTVRPRTDADDLLVAVANLWSVGYWRQPATM